MMPVILIVATMWQQGYWIGGQPGSIVMTRAPGVAAIEADITWQLKYGQRVLQQGRLKFAPDAESVVLRIIPPPPTQQQSFSLDFEWTATATEGGQTLAQDRQRIHVYSANILESPAKHFAERSVMVVGDPTELTDLLNTAGLKTQRVAQVSQLIGREPGLIFVQPGMLPPQPMLQQPLLDMARQGATVVILSQDKIQNVMGHPVVDRGISKLTWRTDHLLLATLGETDWPSMLKMSPDATTLRCIRIKPDEPANALVYILDASEESPVDAPVDALLVIQKAGEGRLVISQLPVGSWKSDPRMHVMLANLLEWTISPVAPTPSQAELLKTKDQRIKNAPK